MDRVVSECNSMVHLKQDFPCVLVPAFGSRHVRRRCVVSVGCGKRIRRLSEGDVSGRFFQTISREMVRRWSIASPPVQLLLESEDGLGQDQVLTAGARDDLAAMLARRQVSTGDNQPWSEQLDGRGPPRDQLRSRTRYLPHDENGSVPRGRPETTSMHLPSGDAPPRGAASRSLVDRCDAFKSECSRGMHAEAADRAHDLPDDHRPSTAPDWGGDASWPARSHPGSAGGGGRGGLERRWTRTSPPGGEFRAGTPDYGSRRDGGEGRWSEFGPNELSGRGGDFGAAMGPAPPAINIVPPRSGGHFLLLARPRLHETNVCNALCVFCHVAILSHTMY